MNVFELFKEEAAGVGVIASKKQAKDPRYSHSLTVDVRPDTPKKNQKALGLTEATAQEKAAWLKIVQPYAERAAEALETNPKFILDQWALESGYKIPKNNNLGGLTKRGEKSGFREYDDLEGYTRDWVNQINKNWPDLKGVETMDDYVDVLQTKGKNGVYAKEEPDTPTYRERLAGMQTGYVPSEEAPTVFTTPAGDDADRKAELQDIIDNNKDRLGGIATQAGRDAYLELQKIKKAEKQAQSEREDAKRTARSRQNAIATLQKEFQDAMEQGDGKAMNDIMASVRGLGGSQAAQQVAQSTFEPTTVTATPAKEEEKSYAERVAGELDNDRLGKEEAELNRLETELEYAGTEDAFGGERQSKEEVDAQKKELKREIDVKKRAIAFIKDPSITSDGGGSMTPEQLEFLKAKEIEKEEIKKAKEQGREPNPALIGNKSVGELELDAARAYRYAAQAKKEGRPAEEAAATKEGDANMKVRQDMVDLGVTWMSGAGNPDQAQRTIDDVKAGNTTGINLFQKPEGKEREQFQQNQAEADRQDAEQGEGAWDRTSTLDDEKKKVDPTPIDKREPTVEPELPKSTTAAKTSYSGSVASAGGATSKGGGYGQGAEVDATVSVTPKEDPYLNPGYTGEELRIYNQLSDTQKAKVIGDFEKSKKYTDQRRKNITPRTGPTSIPDAKPRSLLDIKHQQTLSKIEGGKVLVDPAQDREISKALTKNYPNVQSRNAAIEKLRYTAPSMQDIQKGMTPIVDKSTTYKPDRNANAYDGKIGDYIRKPNSDIGQAIVSTAPRTGPGANANTQTYDPNKNKSIQQQQAERQAKIDQQKAEQEAKKAEQKAKQEARKAEDERRRQEQKAEQERRVSGSTQTVGAPVKEGESAIFRAISGK